MLRDLKEQMKVLERDHEILEQVLVELSEEDVYNNIDLRFDLVGKCFEYISEHIIREEHTMAWTKYTGLAEHEQAHEQLQENFLRYMRQILSGELSCQEAVDIYGSMFRKHIEVVDAPFYSWVKTLI